MMNHLFDETTESRMFAAHQPQLIRFQPPIFAASFPLPSSLSLSLLVINSGDVLEQWLSAALRPRPSCQSFPSGPPNMNQVIKCEDLMFLSSGGGPVCPESVRWLVISSILSTRGASIRALSWSFPGGDGSISGWTAGGNSLSSSFLVLPGSWRGVLAEIGTHSLNCGFCIELWSLSGGRLRAFSSSVSSSHYDQDIQFAVIEDEEN